jgi:aerobic C4-dicarboxylate transport protein
MLRRFFGKLYVQVLICVIAGVLLGALYPSVGAEFKPFGDVFIKLIKMVFAPIIFAMVVLGIAKMESMKELGRVGARALIYFELVSTFALGLGLVVVNVFKPGVGMNVNPATLDTKSIANYTAAASKAGSFVDFLVNMVPSSIVDALAKNDILQILVFGVFFGVALSRMGRKAKPVVDLLDSFCNGMFGIVGMIMRLAPLAAFGAMAFTVGKYGLASLTALGQLMMCMYLTCVVFVFVVLGSIAKVSGFNIFKFLRYLKDEIFTVLGTSSSESVVPQLMRKLEHVGVSKPLVGLVIPSGVTFNPDGQCIYYTMAAIFIAQATNTPLSVADQIALLGVLMLTSKGSAGVTGSGFITLAATLASTGNIPVAGMVLLLGVDRFMSEARAITNTIGNAVATVAVARWVGALDLVRMNRVLDRDITVQALYDADEAIAHAAA